MHVEEMLRQINNNATELSPWESDFIASMNESVETNFAIKPGQIKKIEEIHERVFGKGGVDGEV